MITAGLTLLAFVVAMILTAWIYETDIRRYQHIAAQARRDTADANYRAAVAAERAEHARAQAEWGGRWQ